MASSLYLLRNEILPMRRNLRPTEEQVFAQQVKTLTLALRRATASKMLEEGAKPRHIRKLLGLSGRQFRKAASRKEQGLK